MERSVMAMNWVDVAVLVCLAFGVARGLRAGLVSQVVGLASAIAGIALAVGNCLYIANATESYLPVPFAVRALLAFVAIYLLVILGCRLIVGIWRNLTANTPISWVDAAGGGVFGGIRVLLVSAVIVHLASFVPFEAVSEQASRSMLMKFTTPLAQEVWERLPDLQDRLRLRQPRGVDV